MDDIARLAFYYFWKEQYVVRNAEFRKLEAEWQKYYDEFYDSLPESERPEWESLLCHGGHNLVGSLILPVRTTEKQHIIFEKMKDNRAQKKEKGWNDIIGGVDSKDILEWGILGDLGNEILKYSKMPGTYPYRAMKHNRVELLKFPSEQENFIDIRINLDDDIEAILDGVRREYDYIKRIKGATDEKEHEDAVLYMVDQQHHDAQAIFKAHKKESPNIPAKDFSHESRAVGLWLWDQVEITKITVVAKHIRKLKEIPQVKRLGFAESEMSVLRRFYKRTKECIENAKVLPMKD